MLQIFLDFDGTIVDSREAHFTAYKSALGDAGLSIDDKEDEWFGKTTREVIEAIANSKKSRFDFDESLIDDICRNKSKLARQEVLNLTPNKNILEILHISDLDLVYTVFSNSSKESIVKYVERNLDFVKWSGICSGQEMRLSKILEPDFTRMVDEFRVADNLLFIDDSQVFVDMCKRLKYPAIFYEKQSNLKSEIYTYYYSMCG